MISQLHRCSNQGRAERTKGKEGLYPKVEKEHMER